MCYNHSLPRPSLIIAYPAMPHTTAFSRHPIFQLISLVVSLTILASWGIGLWRYTSFGIDHDQVDGVAMRTRYVRIRWPGDGSLWLGGGSFHSPLTAHPREPFDLGAVFLLPPRRPEPQSVWNRLGLWWINTHSTTDGVAECWLGIPAWSPAILTSMPLWYQSIGRRTMKFVPT